MPLLNDLATPGGHSAIQQALAHALLVRVAQLRDVVHGFQPLDLDALPIALKLNITLKEVMYTIHLHLHSDTVDKRKNVRGQRRGVAHQQKDGGQDVTYGINLLV